MKKLFLVLLPGLALASGPKTNFNQPPGMDSEMSNIYHDIANPVINYGSASSFTVTSLSVSTATLISSATIKNLTVTGTVTGSFGKIVQIVSSTTITTKSTTSSTFQPTFLGLNITPTSASNKILILAFGEATATADLTSVDVTILNGASNLMAGNGMTEVYADGVNYIEMPVSLGWIDSPASVSQQTYTVAIRRSTGAGTSSWTATSTTQFMVAMEIVMP